MRQTYLRDPKVNWVCVQLGKSLDPNEWNVDSCNIIPAVSHMIDQLTLGCPGPSPSSRLIVKTGRIDRLTFASLLLFSNPCSSGPSGHGFRAAKGTFKKCFWVVNCVFRQVVDIGRAKNRVSHRKEAVCSTFANQPS